MGLLGTKTSLIVLICISYWPQYSLQYYDLTGIFCKKSFHILFNISKSKMAAKKVRKVFLLGHRKHIDLLQFSKIHFGLVTIVSAKQWLKHEISEKMFLFVMFSSFHLFCSFSCFTFTLDKIQCWWKYFHIFLPLLTLFSLLLFYRDCSVTLF